MESYGNGDKRRRGKNGIDFGDGWLDPSVWWHSIVRRWDIKRDPGVSRWSG